MPTGAAYGVAYVKQRIEEFDDSSFPMFYGHWEAREPKPALVENGPGWESLADALAWARERAPVVVLTLGRTSAQQVWSAGTEHPNRHLPVWRDGG